MSIAAPRRSPAWFWGSTAAACAAASPTASPPPKRDSTIAYLRGREQVTSVYLETMRRIELEDEARRQVRALTYIVDRGHVQYAGRLSVEQSVHYVRQGHGRSGQNRDYVVETVRALEALGYRESDLHRIADRLKGASRGIRDQASR